MYRRLQINVLHLFNDALICIQQAQNFPDCPHMPIEELRSRITLANDCFVAICVSETWEDLNAAIKSIRLCRDYCDYLDSHVIRPKDRATWGGPYRKAASSIDQIESALAEAAVKEYQLF